MRNGMTLIELIVVLAILGVLTAVAGVSTGMLVERPPVPGMSDTIAKVRTDAILRGRALTSTLIIDGRAVQVTALPDGSVLTRPHASIDHLTGRPKHDD